jgi:hypothetical protein
MLDTELLPKPKSEPARRLEVFTGSDRRRAWSAEQKAGIVAEIRAPWLLLSTCSRGGERAHR